MNVVSPNSDLSSLSSELGFTAPEITAWDRLGLTIFFAIVLHAILILGISFNPELIKALQNINPPLEVTLVHQRSEEPPDNAELLAQHNLIGDGNRTEAGRPSSPKSRPALPPKPGILTQESIPLSPQNEISAQLDVVTQAESELETKQSQDLQQVNKNAIVAKKLAFASLEIARLNAEVSSLIEEYATRDRQRYISSQAKEYRDAAYVDAWSRKIERIGTINYPEEARRQQISGSLMLDVAINSDGTIHKINVLHSSGYPVLDDAAKRIVRLASPFAPFTEEMRRDTDTLHIIRTWRFLDNHRLTTTE